MGYVYEEIVEIEGKQKRITLIEIHANDEIEAEDIATSYSEDLEKDISEEYGYPLYDVHVECVPLYHI